MESERIDHEAMTKGELPKVTWEKIIEHIDHAVKVAGADHVGLGSDFDGATMPFGMEDASKLPKITDALLKKGYSDADIEKILGGNILRVMEQVERVKGIVIGFGVQGSGFRVRSWFLVRGSGSVRVLGSPVLGSGVPWFPATLCTSADTDAAGCLHRWLGRRA